MNDGQKLKNRDAKVTEKNQISSDITKVAKDTLDGSAEKNRNLFIAVNQSVPGA
jgi:hypothetical protein